MQLKVLRLCHEAQIPQFATTGAACFDLHALENATIAPGTAFAFGTGLAFEIPHQHALMVYSRSGHGFKHAVNLINGTGVIDADYRGEVKVKLMNHSDKPFVVTAGDRIAQAMLIELPKVQLAVVTELSDTARGTGGFGSTGN